jgi:hypothetical protein
VGRLHSGPRGLRRQPGRSGAQPEPDTKPDANTLSIRQGARHRIRERRRRLEAAAGRNSLLIKISSAGIVATGAPIDDSAWNYILLPGEATRGHVVVPEPNRRLATDLTTTWTKRDGVVAIVPTIDCGCRTGLSIVVTQDQHGPEVLASAEGREIEIQPA